MEIMKTDDILKMIDGYHITEDEKEKLQDLYDKYAQKGYKKASEELKDVPEYKLDDYENEYNGKMIALINDIKIKNGTKFIHSVLDSIDDVKAVKDTIVGRKKFEMVSNYAGRIECIETSLKPFFEAKRQDAEDFDKEFEQKEKEREEDFFIICRGMFD